ncbi:NAD(P)/FAD-dependent oxidoreductase [Alicyclobacillus fodiniaquatilis]|uniref:NAD(P)/FAD-dependent oxidoreductase n=1 Tax=Alicyclobacillus fodiniaquatilis TaxID=1661150 RepID=A0ABW4JDM1_9BACL
MTQARHTYDVVIVGAGAAGIGMGVIFSQLGVSNFVVLERGTIGASFQKWPQEMRFITPSFPGQGFGALDLNAIVPDTSPGYTLAKEHMSGCEYAEYLEAIARHFAVPVAEHMDVQAIHKKDELFQIQTGAGVIDSRFVVWAAGEFQYPREDAFAGEQYCLHNSQVQTWAELEGEAFLIIGGNESGMDAADHLVQLGKQVTVVTSGKHHLEEDDDEVDPSLTLSPFTYQRLEEASASGRLTIKPHLRVTRVEKTGDIYRIHLSDGETWTQLTQPICATGFRGGLSAISDHFDWEQAGEAALNQHDESTKTPGLFVVGPSVKHGNVILCFIYKFRQRFAVVAEEIGKRLGMSVPESVIAYYQRNNMYLDDLSCCEVKCEC